MEASAKGDNGKPSRYLIVSDGTNLWHWRSAPNTYTQVAARGKNPETGKDFSVTMRAVYDVHETRPRFTAADFAFTPPRGAKKVDATRKDRKPLD